MTSQTEMQDLLRLFTTGRNKIPILTAMQRVKALQTASITPSISTIASTPLDTLQSALSIDEKVAKSLVTACKNAGKTTGKRSASETDDAGKGGAKRVKTFESAYSLPVEQTEEELEKSLQLPEGVRDEERIEKTTIYTNRAPLVLVWTLQLLKYTMPGQGLSGRLSLAQALISANSKSKAESLGLKGKGKDEDEGKGWPKVKIMGREVGVLKRGGYGSDSVESKVESGVKEEEDNIAIKNGSDNEWAVSTPFTSKSSTFIARSISVSSPGQARTSLQTLLKEPSIADASHNITALRIQGNHGIIEHCEDDGESGGGKHILGVLQSNNIVGVLLVVSRWYGGVMLGPDRWRIMTQVSNDALSQRLRVTGNIGGGEQLWGLDIEAMSSSSGGGIMPIHRPEGARRYVLNAFASPPGDASGEGEGKSKKKKTAKVVAEEKEENLGLLMGALDLLLESWVDHIGKDELDRRAWGWYVQVRPEVEGGVAGWGGKGVVKLSEILALRRNL
ncbi:hypothetical protein SBOR_5599 [Sclerotinia borealis F-4128]|uniref:Impact N-terminal domain-containing protein n=1 Tax=Sclerotinia borealis (strain F-4128) TaxID=1432307 RepID=W9CDS8_SCLBF|nr:hypothetical protein SBOR_5599 [Sclerotinia borealis F-4128]